MSPGQMPPLVGEGDSSFGQLPYATSNSREQHEHEGAFAGDPPELRIRRVSCGVSAAFAIVVTSDADRREKFRIFEWGTSLYGERLSSPLVKTADGPHPPTSYHVPVEVFLPQPGLVVRHIVCGAHFVVAAVENGGCVSWGGGRDVRALGRIGCAGCSVSLCTPISSRTAPGGSDKPDWVDHPFSAAGLEVASLAAGDDHVVAVCEEGSAWAWGRGDCGQLGCGPPVPRNSENAASYGRCTPSPVCFPKAALDRAADKSLSGGIEATSPSRRVPRARAAACGRDHSALVADDGSLWMFGSGLYGQLGLGTVGERAWTPKAVTSLDGVGSMREDGSFSGISSVACGTWHTAALATTGDIYTWGWARFGALGPSPIDDLDFSEADLSGASGGNERYQTRRRHPKRAETSDAEVRPFPGLVDRVDDLLSEDDEVVSLGCGARYTLAHTRKKRAFVWGQVAPADANGTKDEPALQRLSRPRELMPADLLQDAGTKKLEGTGDVERGSGGLDNRQWDDCACAVADTRWCISALGCGPWYCILGLERDGAAKDSANQGVPRGFRGQLS